MSHAQAEHPSPTDPGLFPALYISHGAPPLLDDALWVSELQAWSARLPRPTAILVVSAHWEEAPLTIGATTAVPLIYDFGGFPAKYYQLQYPAPSAPALADQVRALLSSEMSVHDEPARGLDHGAYIPLMVMYPDADIPILQISLPGEDPLTLLRLGQRLAALRAQGVLIIGSGFMTHGLQYLRDFRTDAPAPAWSSEFDAWSAEAIARRDLDALADFKHRAPGMPYAHPTAEHFVPLFITLGASIEASETLSAEIEGYFLGLSKRSIQVG